MNKPPQGVFEQIGQNLGKKIDNGINVVSNTLNQVKNTFSDGYETVYNTANKRGKQAQNKLNATINAISNTYQDVTEKTQKIIDTGIQKGKNMINAVTESTKNTIMTLEKYKNQLTHDVKQGLITSIHYAKNTGHLILNYGDRTVNLMIGNVKNAYQNISKKIKQGAISAIQFTKDGIRFIDQTTKKAIKYSIATAVAAGIIVYENGKMIVNKTLETGVRIGQEAKKLHNDLTRAVKEKTLQAITIAKNAKNVVIHYANKAQTVSMQVALQAGIVIKKGSLYVLNTAHQAVKVLDKKIQEQKQAIQDGIQIGENRAEQYNRNNQSYYNKYSTAY